MYNRNSKSSRNRISSNYSSNIKVVDAKGIEAVEVIVRILEIA
jgi:hypothetical protein